MRRMDEKLLLLIDDSVIEQRLLVELLMGQNYRLAIAQNGLDGYRKAVLNTPDLILLDINMPGLDGLCVCRMLKANPATKHIPIIFLTSHNHAEQRVEGLLLGAVDYVQKSGCTEQEVLLRVRHQLLVGDAVRSNQNTRAVAAHVSDRSVLVHV